MEDLNQEKPLFTVVIATRNRPQFLARALRSLSKQVFRLFDVVVVNDGSDIPGEQCISYNDIKAIDVGSPLHYYELSVQKGVAFSRNFGIEKSVGKWVVFLDDDDEMKPSYLLNLYNCINTSNRASVGFYWCNVEVQGYDKDETLLFRKRIESFRQDLGQVHIRLGAIQIGASFGLAIKRQVLDQVGLYDASFRRGEDTELVVRMLGQGVSPGYIEETGIIKREYPIERLNGNFHLYSEEMIYERILSKHCQALSSDPILRLHLQSWCALVHLNSERRDLAKSVLLSDFEGQDGHFVRAPLSVSCI